LNERGVNVDEELSMLIVVQTAYAAAARAVSAADEMFDELLNAFR
jgi:flagellar hook-associated protein 1 FlgK